jgi:hypothetical protein
MSDEEPSRADFTTWRTLPTRWGDEDVYGHVNNVVYYSYFDTAVNGWLMDAVGTDIRDLPALGVVAETGCRFLRQLRFPDVVEAGIGRERLGRSSITYGSVCSPPARPSRRPSARSCTCTSTGTAGPSFRSPIRSGPPSRPSTEIGSPVRRSPGRPVCWLSATSHGVRPPEPACAGNRLLCVAHSATYVR